MFITICFMLVITSFAIRDVSSQQQVQCPRICSLNEFCNPCGAICERRCSDKGPRACPRVCYPAACACEDGYARDSTTDSCVALNQCPQN